MRTTWSDLPASRKAVGKKAAAAQQASPEPDGLELLCAATAAGSAADTVDEDATSESAADAGLDALSYVTSLRRSPSGHHRDGLALLAQSSEEIGCRSPRMLHAALTLGDTFGMDESSSTPAAV